MSIKNRCYGCMEEKLSPGKCLVCGWESSDAPVSIMHLSPGTVLQEKYLIGRAIGQGGFGITYIAWDLNLNMKLAIKEFFPRSLAHRSSNQKNVNTIKNTHADSFIYGLDKFLTEAQILARFNEHPNIISVRDYFRANGTAYLVMNYVEGISLEELLLNYKDGLSVKQAVNIMAPIMDALKELHAVNLLHRDISPDNILINKKGQVILADFGAARQSVGDQKHGLSVVVKPGYAPEEQYRSNSQQGPWTDIYAIAATMYHMITGKLPVESLDRLTGDTLAAPSDYGISIEPYEERALMKALSVKSAGRYQDISEFQEELLGEKPGKKEMEKNINMTPFQEIPNSYYSYNEPGMSADQLSKASSDQTFTELQAPQKSLNINKPAIFLAIAAVLVLIVFVGFITLNGMQDPDTSIVAITDSGGQEDALQDNTDGEPDDTEVRVDSGNGTSTPVQPGTGQQVTVNVPGDYSTIQEAIDNVSNGTRIVVQPGVYNENISFKGKAITLESIDPQDIEVVSNTIIDGNNRGSVVTLANGEDNRTKIAGFTIRGGSGTRERFTYSYGSGGAFERIYGGGIFIANYSSPIIANNIIENNTVRIGASNIYGVGGGVAILNHSSPVLTDNTIRGNNSDGFAGGVAIWYNSSPKLYNNIIEDNNAEDTGGGIIVAMDCVPNISDNYITGNTAQSGGGIYIAHGSYGTYSGNSLSNNRSDIGAGFLVWRTENVLISNNNIYNNSSQYYGGGIFVGNDASLNITGNVFENNSSRNGGAIWVAKDCRVNGNVNSENTFAENRPDNVEFSPSEQPDRLPWP